MVKLADIGTLVWLIIAVMVVVAKSWSKSQKQVDDETSESKDDLPPITAARRGATPPVATRSQLQPRKLSGQPRPVPPRAGPVIPVPRAAQPSPRPVPRMAARPVGSPAPREGWRIDPEQIRRFVEQLSGQPQATPPPPVAPPPIQEAPAPAPPPVTEPAATLTETMPTIAEVLATPSKASRASQWAEALRDRQNIRNIIISAEIIGPPKAF